MSDNEHGDSTMPDHGLAYPADRMRGHGPDAREWAVAVGFTPRSYYVVTETWADLHGRYAAREIVQRGLTKVEADAHAYALNNAAGGGPGAGERVQSGGTGSCTRNGLTRTRVLW